jgi:hypothetical protein
MRRLLAARGTPVAAVGVLALLIAGGAYALASSGGKSIHACVHKHGGDIYIAKKCAKHDQKLSWNQVGPKGPAGLKGPKGATGNTGPQGPGAATINYYTPANGTSAAIGKIGPYTLSGTCTLSAGKVTFSVLLSGPGTTIDGFSVDSSPTAFPQTGTLPGPIVNGVFTTPGPTATQDIMTGQILLVPTTGTTLEVFPTAVANGPTPGTGSAADTCHFASTTIPTAAPPASAHASGVPRSGARWSGPLLGRH